MYSRTSVSRCDKGEPCGFPKVSGERCPAAKLCTENVPGPNRGGEVVSWSFSGTTSWKGLRLSLRLLAAPPPSSFSDPTHCVYGLTRKRVSCACTL